MFRSIMHIAFFTDKMDEMIRFYTEVLGADIKVRTTYRNYLNRDDRPMQQKIAREDPDRIFNVYLQLAEGQFIELFPKKTSSPHFHSAYWCPPGLLGPVTSTTGDVHPGPVPESARPLK